MSKRICDKCGYAYEVNCNAANIIYLCPKCFNETRRIVSRPERDILKQEIRTTPFLQIGKKYGVTDNAIRKWCKFYNLPSKKKEINEYNDEEWIKI